MQIHSFSESEQQRLLTEFLLVVFQSDTCYAEGTFIIDIVIPADYPFKPPKVSREASSHGINDGRRFRYNLSAFVHDGAREQSV